MGCFSYLCKGCNEALLSSSFTGDHSILFLLKEGEVIQSMRGRYDSYGRVLKNEKEESYMWDIGWSSVCDLMFNGNESSGIAAFHTKCYNGEEPTIESEGDPNQGWGDPDAEPREYYDEYE